MQAPKMESEGIPVALKLFGGMCSRPSSSLSAKWRTSANPSPVHTKAVFLIQRFWVIISFHC